MSNNPMLTIRKDFERIPANTLRKFKDLPLGWICDANGRKGALGGGILPVCNNTPFVGQCSHRGSGAIGLFDLLYRHMNTCRYVICKHQFPPTDH